MNDLTYQLTNMWDIISVLLVTGLMVGIVAAVVIGAVRIGWAIAPWLVGFAFLVWLFGG
jgi:Mg/Co/Ni transporter MgtE